MKIEKFHIELLDDYTDRSNIEIDGIAFAFTGQLEENIHFDDTGIFPEFQNKIHNILKELSRLIKKEYPNAEADNGD